MFVYTNSAPLWLSTCHCHMAIVVADEALGHVALTMEDIVFFWPMVLQQAVQN
jgi:hypothetical protein